MKPKHIDHIDPTWEDGRDYQLVCGLNTALNFTERDPSLNISKSNRFLPWRVIEDEVGTVPIEQGDLCLFLDPATNEWVLEEFMGSWWMEASKHTDAKSATKIGVSRPDLSERNSQLKGTTRGPFTDEHKANLSKALKNRVISDETRRRMSESARRRAKRPGEAERRSKIAKSNNTKRNSKGQFTK